MKKHQQSFKRSYVFSNFYELHNFNKNIKRKKKTHYIYDSSYKEKIKKRFFAKAKNISNKNS
jgi:hypothetical protein